MRVYNLIYPCFLILGMESKQCPKCMEVDQHLNFPKIPMEKHELAIKQFGVTSYGGCPNVMCNMKLVQLTSTERPNYTHSHGNVTLANIRQLNET